jgi:hypothetical protein
MKSISLVGLAILAIVGLAAGAVYLLFDVGGSTKSPTVVIVPPAKAEGTELYFPQTMIQWVPESAGEFEVQTPGTYDFWFKNKNSMPVTLAVNYKSCKCSDLFICLLSRDDTDRFPLRAAASGASVIATGSLGASSFLGLFRDADASIGWLGPKMRWQPISPDNPGLTIDPQCGGVFRVTFKGEKIGPARLAVNLWSQAKTEAPGPPSEYRLEVPVKYVPALRVSQPEITFGALDYGEEKTQEFVCWSSTRAGFSLQAKESSDDPCFRCTCTPLTENECVKAAGLLKARVLAGYNVKVSVQERVAEGGQLDLGSFARKLVLTSGADMEETSVEVQGRVPGGVTVGAEEDKGDIVLGEFAAKTGKTKTMRLRLPAPGADLQFDRVEPPTAEYIKVKSLTKVAGDGRDWDLCAEVLPGCPVGKLPRHSAIVLKIQGKNPRGLRIPVRGFAFQQ